MENEEWDLEKRKVGPKTSITTVVGENVFGSSPSVKTVEHPRAAGDSTHRSVTVR